MKKQAPKFGNGAKGGGTLKHGTVTSVGPSDKMVKTLKGR